MPGWSSKSVSTGPRPEERWRSKSEIASSTTSADATVSSGPGSRSSGDRTVAHARQYADRTAATSSSGTTVVVGIEGIGVPADVEEAADKVDDLTSTRLLSIERRLAHRPTHVP
jgi:hypothetical protein